MYVGSYYSDTTPTAYLKPAVISELYQTSPDMSSLTSFLMLTKGKNIGVANSTVQTFEEDNVLRWVTLQTGVDSSATSFVLDSGDGAACPVYTILLNPVSGETMWVSAKSTDTLTVTRSYGATAAAEIVDGSQLCVLGQAYPEAGTLQTHGAASKSEVDFYTQIFRSGFSVSGSVRSTQTWMSESNEYALKQKNALFQHNADQDFSFLFGETVSTGTGSAGSLVRCTTSAKERISTNVNGGVGTLDNATLQTLLRPLFEVGSPEKLIIGSPLVCDAISNISTNKLLTSNGDTTFGNRIKTYNTGAGTATVILSRKTLSGVNADKMFMLDKGLIGRFFLNGNGKSRDTRLLEYGPEVTKVDAYQGEWISEAGFKLNLEKAHGYAYGITG